MRVVRRDDPPGSKRAHVQPDARRAGPAVEEKRDGPFVRFRILLGIGHVEHRRFSRRILGLLVILRLVFALLAFLVFSRGCVIPAFGMDDECPGHGLIIDATAFDGYAACAVAGFGFEVGGGRGVGLGRGGNRSVRPGLGILLGSRFDREGEGCGCQKEAAGETAQMFPEKNSPFRCCAIVWGRSFYHDERCRIWSGTEFRANTVFGLGRFRRATEPGMSAPVEFEVLEWGRTQARTRTRRAMATANLW